MKLSKLFATLGVTVTFTISSSTVNFKPVLADGPDWCTIAPDEAPIKTTLSTRWVNFYEACRNHDICVFTIDANRDNCDNRFRDELWEICKREFKTKVSVVFREECLKITRNTYYAGVRSSRGKSGFKAAQEEAKRVDDALRSKFPGADISLYYGDIAQELAVYQATHGSVLNASERVIEASIKHAIDTISGKIASRNPQPVADLTEARQKLISFYRDFLGRDPEPGAIESRLHDLRNGHTLEQQRRDIAFSDEARQKLTSFYQEYLGRDPEPGAIESRMNDLLNGHTLEQQRRDIASSDEARQRVSTSSYKLASAFGYAKNSRLVASGNSSEPMAGHINWARGQSESTLKNAILSDITEAQSLISQSPSASSCEAFAYLKNATLTLLKNTTEPHDGHINWCSIQLKQNNWGQVVQAVEQELVNPMRAALEQ